MNKYEVLYILEAAISEEEKEAMVAKFSDMVTSAGGEVENVDKWGMKKFAYPINFKNEGYYVLMNFTADSEFPKELERVMRITDGVVRSMVVKK